MIPLPPSTIQEMWKVLKPYDFVATYGAFVGMDVRDRDLKARVLESMKIQIRAAGWNDHPLLKEELT